MMVVGLAEVRKLHFTTEFLCLFVVEDDKLLVCRGIDIEFKTFAFEDVLHPHGHPDGMLSEFEVQIVSEQCIELQTDQCAFGNHGPVLLLDGEKVFVSLALVKTTASPHRAPIFVPPI